MSNDPLKPECIARFTTLGENYAVLKNEMEHNNTMTEAILRAVQGNGKVGIVTDLAVLKAALKRAWWWLSVISLSLMGIAAYVVRAAL